MNIIPIFLAGKIGELTEREVLRRDHILNVYKAAIGALWTEPKGVINAHLVLCPMPIIARLTSKLTEASLVVGALLLLFGRTRVVRFVWVTIHARLLLVAVTTLFEESANGDLLWHVEVQILALISLSTHAL